MVALSVALLVLSAVAVFAVPAWQRRQSDARAAQLARDLTEFAAAFKKFAHERRDWPPSSPAPSVLPAGMEKNLPAERWHGPTPAGGGYAWVRDTLQRGERYQAAIVIVGVGAHQVRPDRRLLAAVDRALDDGNLDTGRFRLGFRLNPVFVLEH